MSMLQESLARLIDHQSLSEHEMGLVMNEIMEGKASPAQIGGLLAALRIKGETVDEIVGAAKVMREKSVKVNFSSPVLLDTCGTGGDGANTFNISTTAAFIVAGAGLPVAKHGNRAVSSRCGSADLLEALGVKLDCLTPVVVEKCLKEAGIGFLFAPAYHPALKHASLPRRELGFRTIFNLLGPLANPAGANYQLIGVSRPELVQTLAMAAKRLGVKRAMVVHGGGGLDELTLEGVNMINFLDHGHIRSIKFRAGDLGLDTVPNSHLYSDNPSENARITEAILKGDEQGPKAETVFLNVAAALMVGGVVDELRDGLGLARETVKNGRAYAKLELLRRLAA